MEPIAEGSVGIAVEDIQERLSELGYAIDATERTASSFGSSTANSVARFRLDHGLPMGTSIDTATWSALVDEGYRLGDRTLYLRLPNFHGRDVRQLQERLNILGFSCGTVDGCYGVHTEAAVRLFQESVGLLGDGMAFQETYDAIERLRHVWAGKPANGPHPMGGMGFARAANVLESSRISITGEDPIARNVAARAWNLAGATTEKSGLDLVDSADAAPEGTEVVLVLSSAPPAKRNRVSTVPVDELDTFPRRLRAAIESSRSKPPVIRLTLPDNGTPSFTVSDAQTLAVVLLDAICTAFAS